MATFDPDEAGKRADELIASGKTATDVAPEDLDIDGLNATGGENDDASGGEDFEHKYNVLQGKYNAEVTRLQEALSSALLERERLAARPTTDPVRAAVESKTGELEERIALLQAEYPNMFIGIDALITQKVTESIKPVQSAVENVAATTAKTERERYLETLDRSLPKWREVNRSPEFMEWLKQADRYTSVEKRSLLGQAYNSFNVETTKAFFEDFAKEKGLDLGVAASVDATPAMETHLLKREASFDISPTPAPGGAKPGGGKPTGIIQRADIETFYKDRAMGRFSGTEEEAVKTEARILRAVQEGRVR
jgi:hypothetical protein